jgi:flagellar biosynthesis/type III secretory pathway protein FliH
MPPLDQAGGSCPPGARRIPAKLWDAAAEARRRVAEAEAEARTLVAAARAEAETIRLAAGEAGREEGLARALECMTRAALERDRLLRASREQLVELAFDIAGRVLASIAEGDRRLVVETAARALELARRRAEIRLRAHPEDLEALRAAESRLLEQLQRAPRIAFEGDAGVGRGGVVVETEGGIIDARLATQLEGLRRALGSGAETGAPPAMAAGQPPGDG